MNRVYLKQYGPSNSARALAQAMGVRRIKLQNSRYVPRSRDVIINWGTGDAFYTGTAVPLIINLPSAVQRASNKLTALQVMSEAGVPVPPFVTTSSDALGMLEDGDRVVARTLLRANSGRGIVMLEPGDVVPIAPLYTRYIPKQEEYRVHVCNDTVFDTQRKMRNRSVPDHAVNWQVRNTDNGFIFGREGVQSDERRDAVALAAIQAMGLDFGAVDIIYNAHRDQYYVLEVNTAPGLVNTTLDKYTTALTELVTYLKQRG